MYVGMHLAASLVTCMIDAFYGLIASLGFPWLLCLFISLDFLVLCFSLGNPRKPKENKGKMRSSKKN